VRRTAFIFSHLSGFSWRSSSDTVGLEVTKTVCVPVHYALTKRKLSVLDRLTARHTLCVGLFLQLIEERKMNVNGYGEFTREDLDKIATATKLSSAYIQQCRDQALWMWRSHRGQHHMWKIRLRKAKGKWREKLLKREPSPPLSNGLRRKVPIRIDARTGIVEQSKQIKLCPYVLRLSTLKKNYRITVPLNPARYHLEVLRMGRAVDFQLIKRNGRFHAHICVKYDVFEHPVHSIMGIDLGVRRAMATVLLAPETRIRRGDLLIFRDAQGKRRLRALSKKIAQLQRTKKWEGLRQLRRKRAHVAEYFDRLNAKKVAEMAVAKNAMVTIGDPKGIKYENYRGNGKPRLRRMLQQHFPYARRIRLIVEECTERGVRTKSVSEEGTSKRCHRCGSSKTHRPSQSLFWCSDCGLQYNADWNSAINIGSVFLPEALSRRAIEGLAHSGDELTHKSLNPEVPDSNINSHKFGAAS